MKTPGTILLLLLTLYPACYSQNSSWFIAGTVYDEMGKALPSAVVYINNTSINTVADQSGKFRIVVPAQYGKVELIASFVGYRADVKQLPAIPGRTANVVFKLDLANVAREVVIVGKRDRHWRRKWRIFENGLLGDSPFARQCKIMNPESVTLGLDENTGRVTASSARPVLIENSALGYKISFHMGKFESNGKKTFLSGYKFFESLLADDAEKQKKQVRNRNTAFKDSFRNFLVSLSRNNLEEGGFEIFRMKTMREFYLTKVPLEKEVAAGNFTPVTADSVCAYDKDKGHFILYSNYPIIVFQRRLFNSASVFSDYPFKYSQIILPNRYCSFSENGWLITPNGITIHDTWAREGFAEMLPTDYSFPGDEIPATISAIQKISVAQWNGSAKIQLPAIETQQIALDQEGLIHTDEKPAQTLVKPDYELSIHESDHSGTIFDLLKRIPGLRVTFDGASNSYKVRFIENNTNINADSQYDNSVALMLDNVFYSGGDTVIPILNTLTVGDVKSISAVRYGNLAAFGARGANGTLIITTNK